MQQTIFTFGTYHLKDAALDSALTNVTKNTSICSIDTAQLYKNEADVGKYFIENNDSSQHITTITTKIWDVKMRNIDGIV